MTTLDTVRHQLVQVDRAFTSFLEGTSIAYEDINAGGEMLFVGWNPHRWGPLSTHGQRALGVARKELRRLEDLVRPAVAACEPNRADLVDEPLAWLTSVLDQRDTFAGAQASSRAGVEREMRARLATIQHAVDALPSAFGPSETLIVADTNALLWQPDLSRWAPFGPATLVVVATVVSELDRLKNQSRGVAEKAGRVIRQLKEMGRRGDTLDGVKVVGDLWLRETAFEARAAGRSDSLLLEEPDDRILAAALNLRWDNLNAEVRLGTRDRNMQNKARMLRLATADVEDLR